MKAKDESITNKLLSADEIQLNKTALDIVKVYNKASDIIERTHIAMGKKSSYKITNSATKNQKLNTTNYASTY